jgi:RND family efflux transporter MFP subunit
MMNAHDYSERTAAGLKLLRGPALCRGSTMQHTGRHSRVRATSHAFPFVRMVAALLATIASACGGSGRVTAGPPPPTLVKVAGVTQSAIEDASEYVATIRSLASTGIKPEVSGEVMKVFVKSGDRVEAGTPLFQIDPARQQASVASQDAARAAQVAALTFAKQQLERSRTLYQAGAASQQELEQAQANFDAATSQLTALDARLQQERVTLGYYQVRAPGAGVVGDVPIRVGMHVTTDTPLTSIDRNQDLEVDVRVPIDRSGDLKPGLPIVVLGTDGSPLAHSSVFFISPGVDDQTQAVLVKGHVPSSVGLRMSQYVRARIVWKTATGLTVPMLAVVRVNGQPFVFVAEDRDGRLIATQRAVSLGTILGNDVVVLGGLAAGERIVVSGAQKLDNGVTIRTS